MWRKAREMKNGEYKDDGVKNVVKEIVRSLEHPTNLIFTKANVQILN